MIPDLVNAAFNVAATGFTLNNVRVILKDRMLAGFSVLTNFFFFGWTIWNLFFYSHLHQWYSFGGGVLLLLADIWYIGLILYYRKEHHER